MVLHDVLVATLAGLGGMLGWGTADFFGKKAIDEIGDIVSLVWAHVAGSAVLLAFVGLALVVTGHGITVTSSTSAWAGLALFGALQGAVYLFVYVGFGKGQVSVLNPVFASFSGFVALASAFHRSYRAFGRWERQLRHRRRRSPCMRQNRARSGPGSFRSRIGPLLPVFGVSPFGFVRGDIGLGAILERDGFALLGVESASRSPLLVDGVNTGPD